MWPTFILVMRITVVLGLEPNAVSMRSSHLGSGGNHVPRQASTSVPVIATSIDYSSVTVTAPTPTSRPSIASNPAIVIPFLSSSTTTTSPSSTLFSTSALSSIPSSQKATTSTLSYSLSSTALPTSSTQNTTPQLSIKLIYLIPGFTLVGILLGGLIGWFVYRCMLRKPLMPRDDGALLVGPRYIGIQEPERHHIQGQDIERRGQPTQMKNHLPKATSASPHFRWPSLNEKPAFHPDRGFHVPDEYLHDDDPSLALPLTARPSTNVKTRTKSTRTTHTSKSARNFKKSKRLTLAGTSLKDLSSPNSDTTSLALLELYESDEEEETRRKAREVPWESLRHKSIKRGILEQVKEEGKWLDSIRGLAGSTLLGSRPETIMEEGNFLLGGQDADDSMGVDTPVGKRKGYSVPDSDPFADSPTRTHSISPRKRPVTKSRRTDSSTATFPASVESHGIGFQIIPESAATTPNHSPRRSFSWLRKADASNALDKLTRLPTLLAEGRKQSQNPSRIKNNRSTSPVKRTSNNGVDESQVSRRDILPRSPAQLMSPPLQSQICFTPIPATSARVESQNSRDYHSKTRVLSPTKPLVVLGASKSRKKVQSPHNLHRLQKPPLSVNTDTQHEASQGRMLQRPGTNHADNCSKGSVVETQGDTMLEDPMKKVERIMASSWSARDLGLVGMRNLSPTGFGRRL